MIVLLIIAAFAVYVEIANRNSKNMTYRQKVLKAIYPVWMLWQKMLGASKRVETRNVEAPVSFYSLTANLNDGNSLNFSTLKGKKVLLVNTASDCGYTNQYNQLQELYERFGNKLVVIAFPANDFKNQEKGTDEEIREFCKSNFGISFPLMQKITAKRSSQQHPVFQWLTDPAKNGWNKQVPKWNFSKYLVDENGRLQFFFGPAVSPLSKQMINAINNPG